MLENVYVYLYGFTLAEPVLHSGGLSTLPAKIRLELEMFVAIQKSAVHNALAYYDKV